MIDDFFAQMTTTTNKKQKNPSINNSFLKLTKILTEVYQDIKKRVTQVFSVLFVFDVYLELEQNVITNVMYYIQLKSLLFSCLLLKHNSSLTV